MDPPARMYVPHLKSRCRRFAIVSPIDIFAIYVGVAAILAGSAFYVCFPLLESSSHTAINSNSHHDQVCASSITTTPRGTGLQATTPEVRAPNEDQRPFWFHPVIASVRKCDYCSTSSNNNNNSDSNSHRHHWQRAAIVATWKAIFAVDSGGH